MGLNQKNAPGVALQNLIAGIEHSLADDDRFTVESPKRLIDSDTGRLREHDVVITFVHNHHTIVTAIECRDRNRKIGVPDVEAFSRKCEKTGINRAVMVSPSGFTATALVKARKNNVACMSLTEAKNCDWCLIDSVTQHVRLIQHVQLHALGKNPPGPGSRLFELPDRQIGSNEIFQIGKNCLEQSPHATNWEIGTHTAVFGVQNCSDFEIEDPDGTRTPVETMQVTVTYRTEVRQSPITFHAYEDPNAASGNVNVASADLNLAGITGKLMFVRDAEGRTAVTFVTQKKGSEPG